MTQEMVSRVVENYHAKKAATQANTMAITAFQQSGGSLRSSEFLELLRERDEAYFQWENARLSLELLSVEERLQIFDLSVV